MEALGEEEKEPSSKLNLKQATTSVTNKEVIEGPMSASQIHIKRLSTQMKIGEDVQLGEKRKKVISRFSAKSPIASGPNKKVSQVGLKPTNSGFKQS